MYRLLFLLSYNGCLRLKLSYQLIYDLLFAYLLTT